MKGFFRKMCCSAVVSACIVFGFLTCCKIYMEIRETRFGEYENAIEITEQSIKIFDYDIKK